MEGGWEGGEKRGERKKRKGKRKEGREGEGRVMHYATAVALWREL